MPQRHMIRNGGRKQGIASKERKNLDVLVHTLAQHPSVRNHEKKNQNDKSGLNIKPHGTFTRPKYKKASGA